MTSNVRTTRGSGRSGHPRGQAVLIAVILTFAIGAVVIGTVSATTITRIRAVANVADSLQSYYAAEAGTEDTLLRMMNQGYVYTTSNSVSVGGATAAITVGQQGNAITITSSGMSGSLSRTVQVTLAADSVGASFSYGVQVGEGGLTMRDNAIVYGNVFSNGNVIGSNNALVTGDVIVAGGASGTVDAEYAVSNADYNFATASSNRDVAQSFAPATSGDVSKVAVYLAKVGSPTDNLKIRLHVDNGDKPHKDSLAVADIPVSSVGTTPSWIEVAFDDTPSVIAGTKYWIVLDVNTSSSTNYWNWRRDTADAYAGHTAKYSSGCCSGSSSWSNLTSDMMFRVWLGGEPTRIENLTIGDATSGTGRANVFVDATIHGSACPNAYCIEESPAQESMPLSTGVIDDWKAAAAAGGTCAPPVCDEFGNLEIPGDESATIGPLVIPGDLKLNNSATLTLTGTVWVEGNIDLNNNCVIELHSSYGANSGVLLADGTVVVSNHCTFTGSGDPDSYPMLLSTYAGEEAAIDVNNNSTGVIYYASNGTISFGNLSAANSAVGYAIELKNNATITYDEGLLDMRFTSGPTGGFLVTGWQETE